jgi:hypothetical protein
VIGLIAALLLFIFKFKQSNRLTMESKLALPQSEKEFTIYKISLGTQAESHNQIVG